MTNKIFEEIVEDETTIKGGYVISISDFFIATIFYIDHSIKTTKLFNSKEQTFVFNDKDKAIDFAKTGLRKDW